MVWPSVGSSGKPLVELFQPEFKSQFGNIQVVPKSSFEDGGNIKTKPDVVFYDMYIWAIRHADPRAIIAGGKGSIESSTSSMDISCRRFNSKGEHERH